MNVTFVTCLLSFSSFLSNSSGFGCQSSNSPFLNVLSDYANSNLQISETGTYPSSIGTISFSVLSHDGSYCGYLLRDAKTSEFIRAYLGDTDPRVAPDFSIDSLFMGNAATPQFSLLPTRSTNHESDNFPATHGTSLYSWTGSGTDYKQYLWLENVPEYKWTYGCAPTAMTMYLSYIDRYCNYFEYLIPGLLPLTWEGDRNTTTVDSIIGELAYDMNTDSFGNTKSNEMIAGAEEYIDERSLLRYDFQSSSSIAFLDQIIRENHLPVVMLMASIPGGKIDHAVLTYGMIYNPEENNPAFVCHSTWNHGACFFSADDMAIYYYLAE